MNQQALVSLTIKNQVANIMIQREESLNALNEEVLLGLLHALEQVEKDVRVITLAGAGGKAFVAGADIKFMEGAPRAALSSFIELGQRVMRSIELFPAPVIAVVNGFAIGGGFELALACDFIVVTEKAKLGQAEVNLGIIPGFGGTQRLVQRAGVGAAKRLVYTAENISGEEAFRLGLADWFVQSTELESKLEEICNTLKSKGPLAIAAAKRTIENAVSQQKLYGLTREVEEFVDLFQTNDTKEGLRAFIEKRRPSFKGQ